MAENFSAFEQQFENIFRDWHIVREIGRGSYGAVYEIQKTSGGVTDKAALKHVSFPKDQFDLQAICAELGTSDEAVVRDYIYQSVQEYRSEYQIMRDLKGMTNIVSCEDFQVIDKKDMPGYDIFIRMELLDTISQLMQAEKFKREEVVKMGMDICNALKLLEKKHILHRDIKPENIFRNQNGDYKLGDFGSARTITGARAIVTAKGTPAYMAPEILLLKEAGPFSDIYSLGLVMFRLMNENRSPFLEAGLASTTMTREAAASRRIMGEKLPKPVNADERLARVILKACEFKPEDRYQTAEEMYTDLAALYHEEKDTVPEVHIPEAYDMEERMSYEGTQMGRRTVLTPEEIAAIEKAERERIEREERERKLKEEKEKQEKKQKTKKIITACIAGVVVVAVIVLAVKLISDSSRKKASYQEAVALIENNDLEGAQKALAAFDDNYEDAKTRKEEVDNALTSRDQTFESAKSTFAKEEKDAEKIGKAISQMKDIRKLYPEKKQKEIDELVKDAEYKKKLIEAGVLAQNDPAAAADALEAMGETEKAQQIRNEMQYNTAMDYLADDASIDQGIAELEDLINKEYKVVDCQNRIQQGQDRKDYLAAAGMLKKGQYNEAAAEFERLATREYNSPDAATRAKEARARELLKNQEYREAKKVLSEADSVDPLINQLKQQVAEGEARANSFTEAQKYIAEGEKQFKLAASGDTETILTCYETAQRHYETAQKAFEDLTDFTLKGTSAASMATVCDRWVDYLEGRIQLLKGNYPQARELFTDLETVEFEDAAAQVIIVNCAEAFEKAENAFSAGDLETARTEFEKLKEMGDEETYSYGMKQISEAEENAANYDAAIQKINEHDYDGALGLFKTLAAKGYKDAKERVGDVEILQDKKQSYLNAQELEKQEEYSRAQMIYQQLDDFEDSRQRVVECQNYLDYEEAERKIDSGELDAAERVLKRLKGDGFEAAEGKLNQIATYRDASNKQTNGDYQTALDEFNSLGQFYNAVSRAESCQKELDYREAVSIMDAEPERAAKIFERLGTLYDSQPNLEKCKNEIAYRAAMDTYSRNDYASAYQQFLALDKYADSVVKATECYQYMQYESAIAYKQQGKYESANDIFVELKDFANSQQMARECQFEIFCDKASDGGDLYTITRNMYQFIFDQNVEYTNKINWARNNVPVNSPTGAELAVAFAHAPQFMNMNISNAKRIKVLSDILMNRKGTAETDASIAANGTYADTVDLVPYLDCGMSVNYVLARMIGYSDYADVCRMDGLGFGEVPITEDRDRDYNTTRFVHNCYYEVLGRYPSDDELNNICARILNEEASLELIIKQFVTSPECTSRNLSNQDYTKMLYKVLFGRGMSDEEVAFNVDLLESGLPRESLLDSLANADECFNNLIQYRPYILQYRVSESLDEFCANAAAGALINEYSLKAYQTIYNQSKTTAEEKRRWAASLNISGTVSDLISSFISYPAYQAQSISNAERVSLLYSIMLDRYVDPTQDPGSGTYLTAMNIGMSSHFVAKVISESEEFKALCSNRNQDPGLFTITEPRDANYELTSLIDRCYREANGRVGNADEINDWCQNFLDGTLDLEDLLVNFLTATEARYYLEDDTKFVETLYRLALNREADEGGLQNYVKMISREDYNRGYIVRMIVRSDEFTQIWLPTGLYVPKPEPLPEAKPEPQE